MQKKKCKNCFLTPDMCGANTDEKCGRIYENKYKMNFEILVQNISLLLGVAFVLLFLILSTIATFWKIGLF